jgi:DNA-binding ferritin-like protein
MKLIDKLTETYCDNFVAYYRAHSCHINVEGRNFYSDHKLLGQIYSDLQKEIDTLGEIIRTQGEYVPMTIYDILSGASLDEDTTRGGADGMLEIVRDALLHLVEQYQAIQELADTTETEHISNAAQERVTALEKFIWQLNSTLK